MYSSVVFFVATFVAILAAVVAFRRKIFSGPFARLEKMMPELEKLRNSLSSVVFALSHESEEWTDRNRLMVLFLEAVSPWQYRKGELLEIAGQLARRNVCKLDAVVEDLLEIFTELVCVEAKPHPITWNEAPRFIENHASAMIDAISRLSFFCYDQKRKGKGKERSKKKVVVFR